MADYGGVRDFVAALTGGGAIEAAAYDAAQQRLIRQRSQQALMDRRIADAAKAKLESDSLAGLTTSMPAGRDRDILISNRGSAFSGLQRGLGYEQQNKAREALLGLLIEAGESGADVPADMFNALVGVAGDKMLSPNNVAVQRQAVAQAAVDEAVAALRNAERTVELPADVRAAEALTGEREAGADYDRARTAAVRAGKPAGSGTKKAGGLPSSTTIALLFPADANGARPEFERFKTWWAEQAEIDPAYQDFSFAYQKFLVNKPASPAGPPEPAGPTKAEAVAQGFQRGAPEPAAESENYGNEADAQILLEAAQDAIDGGADRAAVERILEAELSKLGFTYGTQ